MATNNASCDLAAGSAYNATTSTGCGRGCLTSEAAAPLSVNYAHPTLTVVAVALVSVIGATMFCNVLVGVALLRFRILRNVSNLGVNVHNRFEKRRGLRRLRSVSVLVMDWTHPLIELDWVGSMSS